jgi:hypothetical protein
MKKYLGKEIIIYNYSIGDIIKFRGFVAQIDRDKGITIKLLKQITKTYYKICFQNKKDNLLCLNKKEILNMPNLTEKDYNMIFNELVNCIEKGEYNPITFNSNIKKKTGLILTIDNKCETQMECPFE